MTKKKVQGKVEREKSWPEPPKEKCPYCSDDDWSKEHGRFSVLIGNDMKRVHRSCYARSQKGESNIKLVIR